MKKYMSGRERQEYLLEILKEYMSEECLIDNLMGYFSSDETVAALESICRDYDLWTDDEEDEDE